MPFECKGRWYPVCSESESQEDGELENDEEESEPSVEAGKELEKEKGVPSPLSESVPFEREDRAYPVYWERKSQEYGELENEQESETSEEACHD